MLKRELLFWLIAAAVMAGYIALGSRLAPEVPPEPPNRFEVIRLENSRDLPQELAKIGKLRRAHDEARQRRNEFLRDWYRWGAAVAIGLVLIHTWLRPPWRTPPVAQPAKRDRDRHAPSAPRVLPVSRRALVIMTASLLLVIVALLAIAALFP